MQLRISKLLLPALLAGGLWASSSTVRADEGTVAVGGEFILRIRVPAMGKSVAQRVSEVEEHLVPILADASLSAADIKVVPLGGKRYNINAKSRKILTATPEDGRANHITSLQQANVWANSLRKTLPRVKIKPNPNDEKGQ